MQPCLYSISAVCFFLLASCTSQPNPSFPTIPLIVSSLCTQNLEYSVTYHSFKENKTKQKPSLSFMLSRTSTILLKFFSSHSPGWAYTSSTITYLLPREHFAHLYPLIVIHAKMPVVPILRNSELNCKLSGWRLGHGHYLIHLTKSDSPLTIESA